MSCHIISSPLLIIISQGVSESFILNAGYPPKDILNPSQSLIEAGLVGASVMLKKG